MVGVNGFADLQHFGVRKILNAAAMINAQLVCDLKGLGASNAMDVGERDNHALVGRDINARNTCHIRWEERRVGKECVSTCRSRWSPYQKKKKQPDRN